MMLLGICSWLGGLHLCFSERVEGETKKDIGGYH